MRRKTNLYYEQLPDLHAFIQLYNEQIDRYFFKTERYMNADEVRAFEAMYLGAGCKVRRFLGRHEDADFRTHIPRAEMSAALESLESMEWVLDAVSSPIKNPAAA